jgi:hypothetical protein
MFEEAIKISLGELIGSASRIARNHILVLAVYIVSLTVVGTILELTNDTTVNVIVRSIAGYFLYKHLLRKSGLLPDDRTGGMFWGYLGVSLLTGLATALGILLLIVPGLILMARWSIASGLVICEGRSVIAAMKASWTMTRASQWTIVQAYLVLGSVTLVPMFMIAIAAELGGVGTYGDGLAFASFVTQIASVGSFALSAATMLAGHRATDRLNAVFA